MTYNTQTPPPALFPFPPTNSAIVWKNEPQLQAGAYSQQVNIPANPSGSDSRGIRVELVFSIPPGTFEVDVLAADEDTSSADYVGVPSSGSITAVTAPSTVKAVVEIANFIGQFLVLYCKTAVQNAATCTAKVSRT